MKKAVFMEVGIIGHKGFVGSAFFTAFSQDGKYTVTGIGRENYADCAGKRFGILVNANGNSSKRLADSEPQKDWEMNVAATARFLSDFPSDHYIHISTVEVYPDKSSEEATLEEAEIDPARLSNYGKSKYAGEQLARGHKSHLILRLAGMVGSNMRKGPAYDILHLGKIFVSGSCRYQFLNTAEVAAIARRLAEGGRWNSVYNVVGRGNIELFEFARIAGVRLSQTGTHAETFNVSASKLSSEMQLSSSEQSARSFVQEWKKSKG